MVYTKILYVIVVIIVILVVIYIVSALYLFFNQASHVYFPKKEIISTPADIGLAYKDVTFKTSDGVNITGWYIPVVKQKEVILIFHGNGGNISTRLDFINLFYELGLATFIIDYRGYGKSGGSPSEEGTYLDAEAAWNYLVEKEKVSPENILIFGRSLGGPVAAWLAKDKKPKGLILDSTFTSIKDIGAEMYPYLPVRRFFKFDYNTIYYLEGVGCPVLVIHSRQDDYIPFSHAEKLFESANEPKHLLEIGGSHNNNYLESKEDYVKGIKDFISRY